MNAKLKEQFQHCKQWITRADHREKAKVLYTDVLTAFTEHPRATGETYLEHLWFTIKMGSRLLYSLTVLLIHGIFPFLLTRAASQQIEIMYRIIKKRIPQARRDEIDAGIDYNV